jgi:hypothetical protein
MTDCVTFRLILSIDTSCSIIKFELTYFPAFGCCERGLLASFIHNSLQKKRENTHCAFTLYKTLPTLYCVSRFVGSWSDNIRSSTSVEQKSCGARKVVIFGDASCDNGHSTKPEHQLHWAHTCRSPRVARRFGLGRMRHHCPLGVTSLIPFCNN